ncbi:NAD-P-binding protein [Leptodontidium sp. MPI-SDFR-AT-0119]|nr:NAD-P-binding protein [Leptodontidium sp. MPI-SDFR-AT-0119]
MASSTSRDSIPARRHTVFITGAAAGIGQASAVLFATAGADRITLADYIDATITRISALKAAGKPVPEIIILSIDVRNVQSIEAGLGEMTAHWGHIDILINNPGNLPEAEIQSPSLAAKDIELWRFTWESHIKGTYSVTRALIPLLLQGTDMTVVNLSRQSIESLSEDLVLTCGKEGLLAYSMYAGPKTMYVYENSRFANDEVAFGDEQVEHASDLLVSLTSKRREWLFGRKISSAWSMRELLARKSEIIRDDLLKNDLSFKTLVRDTKQADQRIRGVPRSSY